MAPEMRVSSVTGKSAVTRYARLEKQLGGGDYNVISRAITYPAVILSKIVRSDKIISWLFHHLDTSDLARLRVSYIDLPLAPQARLVNHREKMLRHK